MAFIFDAGKNETPQTLARKRAIIAQIMGQASQQRPARSAAEGFGNAFSSIANGVAANVMNRRADAAEQAGMQGANDLKGKLSDWLKNGAPPVNGGALPTPGVSGEMAATAPDPVNISGSKQEFVNALLPAAMEESQRTGIDPRIIVAQAAQETGWGKSAPGNNYFGIKSHGKSGGNSLMTTEYVNGQPVQQRDSFRAYGSPADSVRGYGDFMLQNPRYRAMREAQGLDAQLAALGASGYATDPNYSRSVGAIAKGIRLPQDGGAAGAIEEIAPTHPPQITQNQFNERFTGSQSELPPLPAGREVGPAPGMNMPTQPQRDAPQQAVPQQLMAPRELPLDLLFQIISNPFSDDGVKALANNMLEQQMRRGDPAYQMQMEKGRLELDALRNPQPKPTDDMREYEFAKSQGFTGSLQDWIVSQRRAGATNVTTNVGEGDKFYENLDKKNAETFSTMSDAGIQARSKLAQIDRLQGLMANAPQGAMGALKQAAGEWGIPTDGLSDIQAASALLEKMVPEQRAPGSGPMSDADIQMFRASLPRILNQPGGNQLIFDTMRGIAQYEMQMGEIADQVADRAITPSEGRQRIRELKNPLESFKIPEGGTPNEGWKELSPGVRIKRLD